MVIGFKPQFKEAIIFGEKKHTIREDKKNRYKVGSLLHMATGVRTKKYHCFKLTDVTAIQPIEIWWKGTTINITIDGKKYAKFNTAMAWHPDAKGFNELSKLSKYDGFKTLGDFIN